MDSYLVRIYRKPRGASSEVTGLVEKIGKPEQKVFRDVAELLAVLGISRAADQPGKGGAPARRRK